MALGPGEGSPTLYAGKSTIFVSISLFNVFSHPYHTPHLIALVSPLPIYRHCVFRRKKSGNPFPSWQTADIIGVAAYGSWHSIFHVITPLQKFDNYGYEL